MTKAKEGERSKKRIILSTRVLSSKPAISIEFNDVDNLAGYEERTRVLYMIPKSFAGKARATMGRRRRERALVGKSTETILESFSRSSNSMKILKEVFCGLFGGENRILKKTIFELGLLKEPLVSNLSRNILQPNL